MPVHAERDIVMANPSVRPSVRPSVSPFVRYTLILYLNECTYRQTLSTIW